MLCITQELQPAAPADRWVSTEPSIQPENNEMEWHEWLIDAITRLCLWLISLLPGRGTHNDPAVPANLATRNIEHIPAPAVSVPAPEAMRPSTPTLAPAATPASDSNPETPGITLAERRERRAARQAREAAQEAARQAPLPPLDTTLDAAALEQYRPSRPVSAQAGPEPDAADLNEYLEENAPASPPPASVPAPSVRAVQDPAPEQQAMEETPVSPAPPAPPVQSPLTTASASVTIALAKAEQAFGEGVASVEQSAKAGWQKTKEGANKAAASLRNFGSRALAALKKQPQ